MWTKSQQTAIDAVCADNIVSAAAGSGKTAVMVERIISRVLSGSVDIDKLLVVTFTNAAAAELKTRLMSKIMNALETCDDPDHLNRQLMLINNASICTIDSFCLNVLRNNFYKLGLDPAVKVADSAELELIKKDVLNDVFEKYYALKDDTFLKIVDSYTTKKDNELAELILSFYEFSVSLPRGVAELRLLGEKFNSENIWNKYFVKKAHKLSNRAVMFYDKAINMVRFTPEYEKVHEQLCYEKNYYDLVLNSKKWADIYKIVSCFEFPRFMLPKSMSEYEKEEIKYFRNSGKDLYKELSADFSASYDDLVNDIAVSSRILNKLLEITEEFEKEFSKIKREKAVVDFGDVEHLTLNLLTGDDGGQSDTAVSLMEKYTEIYVDEFQDCNSVQASIFAKISGENIGKPNMFRVGDMKQSIYGFRGSEPMHFKNALSVCTDYGQDDKRYNKIILNKNFRSRKTIIDSVNSIFSCIMSEEYGEIDYTEEEYLYYNDNSYEDVNSDFKRTELILIDTANTDDSRENTKDSFEDIKAIEYEAIYVANRINEIISDENYLVYDSKKSTYRRATYSDIVVLLRAGSDKMSAFNRILTLASIPVYCEQGEGYYESPEVTFLTDFIKIIDNPYDDVALLSVMRHPVVGFSDDEFVSIRCQSPKGYFYTSIQKYMRDNEDELSLKLKNFVNSVNMYYKKSKYYSTDKLLWEIIQNTEYMSYLAFTSNYELRIANVKALVSRAYEFEKSSYKGIFDFIRYIDSIKKSNKDIEPAQTLSDDENVVRIMTIHKSKGLEFPIVFLANATKHFNDTDIKNGKILMHSACGFGLNYYDFSNHYYYELPQKKYVRDVMYKEMLSEEMRILYVALTRAREKLIITGALKNAETGFNKQLDNLHAEKELGTKDFVSNSKSYTDWIIGAVVYNEDYCLNASDDSKLFKICLINKSYLKLNIEEKQSKRLFECDDTDMQTDEKVRAILNFKYPFGFLADIPSNLSVTELKRREMEDDQVYAMYFDKKLSVPAFYREDVKLSAADIGTLTHLVMEKLDFANVSTKESIDKQISELSEKGFIAPEYIKYIKSDNIYRILLTDAGKSLCMHRNSLKREYSFKYLMPAFELDSSYECFEKIVVQGTIDAYFEDDNGLITLIDYKTDKVTDSTDEIRKRYSPQLRYYKTALEKATKKKVEKMYLFLLDSGDVVECDS